MDYGVWESWHVRCDEHDGRFLPRLPVPPLYIMPFLTRIIQPLFQNNILGSESKITTGIRILKSSIY